MSSREKLEKVFEYLVNEEADKASEMIRSYILETAASVHQDIVDSEEDIMEMERDVEHGDFGEDLADEISADKDEIEAEETLGEDEELDLEEPVEDEELSLEDLADDIDELEDTVHHVVDTQDEFGDKFEKLEAQFAKLVDLEEPEHNVDIDMDGDIDLDHSEEGADLEVMEAIELDKVKVDMKDKTGKQASPVASQKSRIDLGGHSVKITGKGHTGYAREEMKPKGEVTKHNNTVKSGKDAIVTAKKVDTKDNAPHAGKSPAMPK